MTPTGKIIAAVNGRGYKIAFVTCLAVSGFLGGGWANSATDNITKISTRPTRIEARQMIDDKVVPLHDDIKEIRDDVKSIYALLLKRK
jgi:hypothetical protein